MIHLDVKKKLGFPHALLQAAAEMTLETNKVADTDLSIVIDGDDEVQHLNREFLGEDRPTDVLSFPSNEIDPENGRRYLGDVIISLPRAAEQATQKDHPIEMEVQLLTIHGVLHLLGFNHEEELDKQKMWTVQDQVLNLLGISIDTQE